MKRKTEEQLEFWSEVELYASAGTMGARLCSRCGKNYVYATGGPHMDLCEPCVWDLTDHEQQEA
jgi:hypothetical protein